MSEVHQQIEPILFDQGSEQWKSNSFSFIAENRPASHTFICSTDYILSMEYSQM